MNNWTDEEIFPVDKMYQVDTVKLLQYCRWFGKNNRLRSNNLSRDDVLRAADSARADVYESIVGLVTRNQLITKE